jgi:hypothetical protein
MAHERESTVIVEDDTSGPPDLIGSDLPVLRFVIIWMKLPVTIQSPPC